MPSTIGYARVSTDDQRTLRQVDELRAAGCDVVHEEHASGTDSGRPVLRHALLALQKGDVLVVTKLDRLARSTKDLLSIVDRVEKAGAALKVLGDQIDTTTPVGRFFLTLLGAVAEFEVQTIRERTRSGLRAAAARGRRGGNPDLVTRDPVAIRRLSNARKDNHIAEIVAGAGQWLPQVRRMRGYGRTWPEIARSLNTVRATDEEGWTSHRLVRWVRILVGEGVAEASLLKPAPRDKPAHTLLDVVAGIAGATPRPTLKQIASRLEEMRVRTPSGDTRWGTSSVAALIGRAEKLGMLPAGDEPSSPRVGRPRRKTLAA